MIWRSFKECHPAVLLIIQKIELVSPQTQLNFVLFGQILISFFVQFRKDLDEMFVAHFQVLCQHFPGVK
jgi:hypothetical protein